MPTPEQNRRWTALSDDEANDVLDWANWTYDQWATSFQEDIEAGEFDAHLIYIESVCARRRNVVAYQKPAPQGSFNPPTKGDTNEWGVPFAAMVPGAQFRLDRKRKSRRSKWDGTTVELIGRYSPYRSFVHCIVKDTGWAWNGNGGVGTRRRIDPVFFARQVTDSPIFGGVPAAAPACDVSREFAEMAARNAATAERERAEHQRLEAERNAERQRRREEEILAKQRKDAEAEAAASVIPARRIQRRGQ